MTQKYSDNLETTSVEMAATGSESEEEEDIVSETRTLTGGFEKNKNKHRCLKRVCKGLLITTATVMFVVMLVQLWTNYGDYIQNRVFSPTIVGAGTFDADGGKTTYVMEFHKWENDTLHITMNVPENPLVQVEPDPDSYEWGDKCLMVHTTNTNVSVIVWSLWSK